MLVVVAAAGRALVNRPGPPPILSLDYTLAAYVIGGCQPTLVSHLTIYDELLIMPDFLLITLFNILPTRNPLVDFDKHFTSSITVFSVDGSDVQTWWLL